ncbi:S-adenosyl-L-methionine-dependent tRNA 4-demethylwyosine synthase TYW1-like [Mercenaria mercenaria]|uniref:S-adenosyl-L-methionine-dependent tRNA 4-demethylwyosine synthase TYW1-like n=1 Tax=Mercenaria mercenaria TaxID=6596 RepID=UPI00234F1CE2|nr:S-adenosyl-L-methionine-dependent tRNA 4-demethylwyosine synthase TYW1-like [Mercenaria mercenaria]
MLEKLLTSVVSDTFQIPVWTVVLATVCILWLVWERKKPPKSQINTEQVKENVPHNAPSPSSTGTENVALKKKYDVSKFVRLKLKVFYGSQTGKAKVFASQLCDEVTKKGYIVELIDLNKYDPEDNLADESTDTVCVFILSTYTEGTPTESAAWFYKWLEETSTDFRVEKTLLKNLQYCVFGLGNSLYTDHYNVVGKNIDKWLHSLSAMRVMPLGMGDEDVVNSKHGGIEEDFRAWRKIFWRKAGPILTGRKQLTPNTTGGKKEKGKCGGKCKCKEDGGKCSSDEEPASEDELYETTTDEEADDTVENEEGVTQNSSGVVDLEDLGKVMKKMKTAKVHRKAEEEAAMNGTEKKEMVTPQLRKALVKQGYKIVGSHSGVKLCRWTKSMLRGRGGCYKHTFYGIESHRCMETTPSLACANKCVFCWRHHTNPVGTEWRWQMDDPEVVFNGALENHVNMIKQFKGVPGVQPDKFEEGKQPQHCALSLVGEPIMYPEINKFIDLLHDKQISTFLVTNAQFPEAIKNLSPVTQLYVSVDASTKDSLKKIDRPLFKDFWERFLDSLKELSDKGQRTVYRLTLVKAFNTDEIENYAKLVALGNPDFIEIKGVTYCGDSKASSLTMSNVPWHEEVVGFVKQIADELPDYEIASEHEHSNCILLAHKRFKVDGEWWTWIDYPKFHELVRKHRESNGKQSFSAKDYMAKTPHWAVFGAKEQGFDPKETRYFRKSKKDIGGC